MRIFKRIREHIKLAIWDYIDAIHSIFRWLSVAVSLFAMSIIFYYYGYAQTIQSAKFCNIVILSSLFFYIIKYFILFIFNKHSFRYLQRNWIEGVVILILGIWMIITYTLEINYLELLFGSIQVKNFNHIAIIAVQLYFFILMLTEISHIGHFLGKLKLGPGGLLIGSFLILITLGTILLLLPEMTTHGISFIDALFTATSACCITGLSTIDIATELTIKGQLALLLLIQLGGINIICFATFFTSFYKGGNLRYQSIIKELLATNLQNSKRLTQEIFVYTFAIELIGFALIFAYLYFSEIYSSTIGDNIYFAAFHAISSFNNAGFSIMSNGMQNPILINNYYIQTITMLLAFLGGIGFLTIHDVLNPPKARGNKHLWYRLQISTRIILKLSILLWVGGALFFFILEYNNPIIGHRLIDKIYNAFFISISCRSLGFNTLPIGALSNATLLIMIILMSIGTASGSTGGGIKLSTFYILIKSAWSTIKNKRQVSVANRAVSFDLVNKSYVVLLFTIFMILAGTVVLSITDPEFSFLEILFEVTSACGTVGLSMGISPFLSTLGKFILVVFMYIGRITVLTLVISIARKVFNGYSLAQTNLSLN